MKLKLDTPKTIIIQPLITKLISSIDKLSFIDDGYSVLVNIGINDILKDGRYEVTKQLIIWEGQDYIDAGQYTDEMINNRILELL